MIPAAGNETTSNQQSRNTLQGNTRPSYGATRITANSVACMDAAERSVHDPLGGRP
jgi:hypothetical protein